MPQEDLSLTITRKSCSQCRKDYYAGMGACPDCGAALIEVKRDPFIGKKLADRYQVECLVGIGGMGVVYKAWHEALRRAVAVKVLRQQFLNDPVSVKRFQQEAIAASRLNHPHIVSLHDYGSTEDGYLYMVMDLLDGRSLAQEQAERKTIGVERTVRIMSQVCEALEHAHQNGIVHRDLKPGNIMLMKTGDNPDFVKLVDFGIAKVLVKEEDQELTQKGEVFGSPLYMSPEQCLGMDLDGRSDIYALGAVLYESLTGDVPLAGKNMIETIDKQIHKAPEPFKVRRPDIYIPERLEAVVLRALSKNPDDRQQSMRELANDLNAAVPKPTQALNLRSKTDSSPQSNKTAVIGLIALVILGFGISLVVIFEVLHHLAPAARTPSRAVPAAEPPKSGVAPQVTPPPPATVPNQIDPNARGDAAHEAVPPERKGMQDKPTKPSKPSEPSKPSHKPTAAPPRTKMSSGTSAPARRPRPPKTQVKAAVRAQSKQAAKSSKADPFAHLFQLKDK